MRRGSARALWSEISHGSASGLFLETLDPGDGRSSAATESGVQIGTDDRGATNTGVGRSGWLKVALAVLLALAAGSATKTTTNGRVF